MTATAQSSIEQPMASAGSRVLRGIRQAQRHWAMQAVAARVNLLRGFRAEVAADPMALARAVRGCRTRSSVAEILSSEILPLLDACKFAEKIAPRVLRPRRMGASGRPFWLSGVDLELQREAIGLVLIIAPSNYPLFLPGVQALQALVAGNAVVLKPGASGAGVALAMKHLLVKAGLNPALLTLLDEDPRSAREMIRSGVDKIVLTGSAETGREVLHAAAETLTPAICELSGCDAVVVLPGADPELVARSLAFGLRLNASQTCMRPHRVLLHESIAGDVVLHTVRKMPALRIPIGPEVAWKLGALTREALLAGAHQLSGRVIEGFTTPFVLADVPPESPLWQADIFAPVLALNRFSSESQLFELYNACPYALGVSIFGPPRQARRYAQQLNAGFVTINDIIVPTADPRLPFSGRGHSGFGVTRGEEGLLEMTRVKAVSARKFGHAHLQAEHPQDEELFAAVIRAAHGRGVGKKSVGIRGAFKAAMRRRHPVGKSKEQVEQ